MKKKAKPQAPTSKAKATDASATSASTASTTAGTSTTLPLWKTELEEARQAVKEAKLEDAKVRLEAIKKDAEDKEAQGLLPTEGPKIHKFRATWFEIAGDLAMKEGGYEDALTHYKAMIEEEEKAGEAQAGIGNSWGRVGEALGKLRRFEASEEAFVRAIEMKKAGGSEGSSLASTSFEWARMLEEAGRWEEATERWKETLAFFEEKPKKDSTKYSAFLWEKIGGALRQIPPECPGAEARRKEAEDAFLRSIHLVASEVDPHVTLDLSLGLDALMRRLNERSGQEMQASLLSRSWEGLASIYEEAGDLQRSSVALANAHLYAKAAWLDQDKQSQMLHKRARLAIAAGDGGNATHFLIETFHTMKRLKAGAAALLPLLQEIYDHFVRLDESTMAAFVQKDALQLCKEASIPPVLWAQEAL